MKATCDREKMAYAFHMAAGVASGRTPKPILENVKLEVTAERAILMATDLEVGIRVDVPGFAVDAPGSVVLPVKRVGPILRENSDEKLLIESDGTRTRIRGTRSDFQLPSQNPDEFPLVSAFEEESYHQVPARFLRELIRRTIFATDPESSRYALGGVLFEMSEQEIIGVGTDGRRLARQAGPAQSIGGHKTVENTVVPTKALQLMERALADAEEDVQLAARENAILMKSQRTMIYSRLIEGRFPRWRDVFPKHSGAVQIEMAIGPFHSAVRQAAVVTSDEHRGVEFTFGEGKVTLAGHGAEYGESHIEMPIAYDGPAIPVKLDPRFMSDFLRVLEPDKTFTLTVRDAESAVTCATDDGYAYVIMPLSRD